MTTSCNRLYRLRRDQRRLAHDRTLDDAFDVLISGHIRSCETCQKEKEAAAA